MSRSLGESTNDPSWMGYLALDGRKNPSVKRVRLIVRIDGRLVSSSIRIFRGGEISVDVCALANDRIGLREKGVARRQRFSDTSSYVGSETVSAVPKRCISFDKIDNWRRESRGRSLRMRRRPKASQACPSVVAVYMTLQGWTRRGE